VRSLAIREQQLGADHPDTAGSLLNMAALYYKMERYSQALPLIQRAVKIYEQTLNPDHPQYNLPTVGFGQLLRQQRSVNGMTVRGKQNQQLSEPKTSRSAMQ
jgi:tetratricopeptide (TPR) repeat protein